MPFTSILTGVAIINLRRGDAVANKSVNDTKEFGKILRMKAKIFRVVGFVVLTLTMACTADAQLLSEGFAE